MREKFLLFIVLAALLSACGTAKIEEFTPIPGSGEGGVVSYSQDVQPILMQSCWNCHGGEKVSRGLNVSDYVSLMHGSTKGPQVIAGDGANSGLVTVMVSGKMPKKGGRMLPEQIELIQRWIDEGARNN